MKIRKSHKLKSKVSEQTKIKKLHCGESKGVFGPIELLFISGVAVDKITRLAK